ncbi:MULTISPECIES: hypothetical protein [unclassified Mesorhizobium]|nr:MULTISPECIES: hypothetical protein [unclassified Mesorhizobium]ESX11033.1 hypothetical protein X768_12705 [Mesorhizobium sp. LSJC265A00]ESX22620.1 hypothetical protein X767_18320 [Mesorhizobium sp. LSJC264A00]ESY00529.1 hypothetical protein X755_09500 [Mesorhizobium sp. LNJC405B00]ESZ10106.1 hypothetical protein X736_00535 [Mesorhizobium sp. L2C089B000]ESZ67257.1 hypothetical protein X728_02060 [Mesorhizobium sp. L103C120A0]
MIITCPVAGTRDLGQKVFIALSKVAALSRAGNNLPSTSSRSVFDP